MNISHQGEYCVLACGGTSTIGVDVMKTEYRGARTIDEFFSLMDRQFSDSEWVYINGGADDKQRLSRFMRLWCLKESFVKAEGTGIYSDLKTISFSCPTTELDQETVVEDSIVRVDGQPLSDWHFEESLLDKDHTVAVAIKLMTPTERSIERRFEILNAQDVIKSCTSIYPADPNEWQDYMNKQERPY